MVRRWVPALAAFALFALCAYGAVATTVRHPLVVGGIVLVLVAVAVAFAVRTHRAAERLARLFAEGGNHAAALRVGRGEGLALGALAKRLGTTADDLRRFAPAYREARIPKRRGGERRLHIPDDATKAIQRSILRNVLFGLSAHPAATGFERGKSIVDNARPHVGRAVVIRMDVVDFFPATSADRVLRFFQWIGWDREAAEVLAKLTTRENGLPQGAPTSPRLSNLVNRYLDVQIANGVARRGGVYTRYADDITVSLDSDRGRRVRDTIQFVRRVLRHHGYRLHTRRKLHVARRHQRQIVTGLVVNGVGPPPPRTRRARSSHGPTGAVAPGPGGGAASAAGGPGGAGARVGAPVPVVPRLPREIRRRLRATAHRLERGLEPTQGIDQAAGWLAYARMVREQARADGEPPGSPPGHGRPADAPRG